MCADANTSAQLPAVTKDDKDYFAEDKDFDGSERPCTVEAVIDFSTYLTCQIHPKKLNADSLCAACRMNITDPKTA